MGITAEKLILDLVFAATEQTITAKAAVVVARLFDITDNSVRVALARLQARGLLERSGRGRYALAAGAWPLQRHVASWSRLEERRVAWRGEWVGVYLSRPTHIGRQPARRRRRALELLGLEALEPGLWVRPDNLRGGVSGLRTQLGELGLDERSRVFVLGGFDAATEAEARGLWDGAALRAAHRDMTRRLKQSGLGLQKLDPERRLVESFLVGGQAINLLAFDPLLPEEIVAAKPRLALADQMRHYDRLGRACWREYAQQQSIPEIVLPSERSVRDDRAGGSKGG